MNDVSPLPDAPPSLSATSDAAGDGTAQATTELRTAGLVAGRAAAPPQRDVAARDAVPRDAGFEKRVEAKAETLNRWRDRGIRTVFVLLLVGLWQLLHYVMVERTGIWLASALRSPSEVLAWLRDGFGLNYFTSDYAPPVGVKQMPRSFFAALWIAPYPKAIGVSTVRLVGSYLLALFIGFPVGLMVARFALAEKTVGWLSLSLQGLPSICWVPLAQLWLGRFGVAPIIFVTVLGALFATIVSVADGLRNVPPLLSRAGRTLGADGTRLYWGVLLPAALPAIVSGLKIGWSFAWRSLMAAEIIVYSGGLGQLLQVDRDNNDQEGVIATILIIIVLGLGVQAVVFAPIERRIQALWGLSGTRR